jgi:hypothetical protein
VLLLVANIGRAGRCSYCTQASRGAQYASLMRVRPPITIRRLARGSLVKPPRGLDHFDRMVGHCNEKMVERCSRSEATTSCIVTIYEKEVSKTRADLLHPTPAMDDLAPPSKTSNFHTDASTIANQAQQIVIYGGQQNHL